MIHKIYIYIYIYIYSLAALQLDDQGAAKAKRMIVVRPFGLTDDVASELVKHVAYKNCRKKLSRTAFVFLATRVLSV